MDRNVKKVFQKRFYDLLSHKYGILMMFAGAILLTVSAFHFGEAWLEWSKEKYEAVFNSFSDNIVGRSFRERLSLPVPIDVVYTWVNGSDPSVIKQLEALKIAEAKKSNITKEEKCTYTNCLQTGVVILPALPESVSLKELATIDEKFANATSLSNLPQDPNVPANLTMLTIENESATLHLVKKFNKGFRYDSRNYTIKAAFYTSDEKLSHGLTMPQLVLISGYPRQFTVAEMQKTLATRLGISDKPESLDVKLLIEKGVAIVHVNDKTIHTTLLKDSNFTLENKVLRMSSVKLVWDLRAATKVDEIADYRFQDKEELRYSLRSVEQHAPWVRHIYIVTNGQIPHWLNLDNPRISVITHEDIFPNASHLPTFSSPAIEANIHRIPGLSDKFLYLNDDVMFGQPVWPDDFYSHSTGQKLYLSWPVPNCNDGCPSTWINDGYCDKACNSSECEWDGGDCKGKDGQLQLGAGFHGGADNIYNTGSVAYCQAGCANNWLADKYCDQACNNLVCGFDAGDCGTDNFDQLYGTDFGLEKKVYDIPPGETMVYLNLTKVLGNDGKVTAAKHVEHKAIRTAAVGNKYKVMVLLLNIGHNFTGTNFTLDIQPNANVTIKVNFTVRWDTSVEKRSVEKKDGAVNGTDKSDTPSIDELDALAFEDVHYDEKHPKPFKLKERLLESTADVSLVDLLNHHEKLDLSEALKKEVDVLQTEKMEGFLTEKGLRRRLNSLYEVYKMEINSLKTHVEKIKRDVEQNSSFLHQQKKIDLFNKDTVDDKKQESNADHEKILTLTKTGNAFNAIAPGIPDNIPLQKQAAELNLLKGKGDKPEVVKRMDQIDGNHFGIQGDHKAPADSLTMLKDVDKDNKAPDRHGPGRKLLAVSSKKTFLQKLLGRRKGIKAGDKYYPRQKSNQSLEADRDQIDEHQFLKLVSVQNSGSFGHRFPWEKLLNTSKMLTVEEEVERKQEDKVSDYAVEGWQGRHLLDAFGDSLRHVNRIYNKVFGFTSRKVPAHMPHMIDKNVMIELQERFPEEWDATSSHKIRHSQDMQFAFSYYYYIMGVTEETSPVSVFKRMDTDASNVLSDREIRTFAAKVYDLPLYLETLTGLEKMFMSCSLNMTDPEVDSLTDEQKETYYDKAMPQVTSYLFSHCDGIIKLVSEKFKSTLKYKTTVMDDSDVAFKIIHSNVSQVVGQLDDVRKHPKKFICLNDNMEHSIEEAATVKAVLQDFYESLLPIPSQFELPREYRNRFLHMNELRQWRHYRDWLKFWTHVALVVLVLMTAASFLGDKITYETEFELCEQYQDETLLESFQKRFMRRKRQPSMVTSYTSSDTESSVWPNGMETV